MKTITVRINRVTITPSRLGGVVTQIRVTEDGKCEYDLYIEPCARTVYYFEDTYKDLAVSGNHVYAATSDKWTWDVEDKPFCNGIGISENTRLELQALEVRFP